jgi:hypothetical protein
MDGTALGCVAPCHAFQGTSAAARLPSSPPWLMPWPSHSQIMRA